MSDQVATVLRIRSVGVPALIALVAVLGAGCASSAGPAGVRDASGTVTSAPSRSGREATSPTKVLVVIEENHSLAQMRDGMPFLAGLSQKYGYATHWTAITHPSEPNYLAIAGGSTFGVTDDDSPTHHYADVGAAESVFDQAIGAGKTAATYAESMPGNCHIFGQGFDPSQGKPKYAVRHNPWVFFQSGRQSCEQYDVPLPAFATDAAQNNLPNVGFLIPNLDDDAHDGSLSTADGWLHHQLAPVLASEDFTSGRLVVVVTADEDDRKSGNTVLTSVLTPRLSGTVVDTPLTHYSLTRYIADVLGVTPLGNGADAPDLAAAFGL
jgi:phosphatidylinositol-3-phosphatase